MKTLLVFLPRLAFALSTSFVLAASQAWSGQNGSPAETVWLDSLDLATMQQGWGEAQANLSVTRQRLSLGGRKFERGVGTHAPGDYRLNLGGGTEKFEATVGLDDGANSRGSVVFQIFGDGKKLFDS